MESEGWIDHRSGLLSARQFDQLGGTKMNYQQWSQKWGDWDGWRANCRGLNSVADSRTQSERAGEQLEVKPVDWPPSPKSDQELFPRKPESIIWGSNFRSARL